MNQKSVGSFVSGLGLLLLFLVVVVCSFDVTGLLAGPGVGVPLWGYLSMIFTGVAMQFVGSAIPNMEFETGKSPAGKPPMK